ncbi:hypothetical protein INR49_015697 [Caranx melampygus]|nr:hypothetical protein INR49_015697 [Caranx melampygus]
MSGYTRRAMIHTGKARFVLLILERNSTPSCTNEEKDIKDIIQRLSAATLWPSVILMSVQTCDELHDTEFPPQKLKVPLAVSHLKLQSLLEPMCYVFHAGVALRLVVRGLAIEIRKKYGYTMYTLQLQYTTSWAVTSLTGRAQSTWNLIAQCSPLKIPVCSASKSHESSEENVIPGSSFHLCTLPIMFGAILPKDCRMPRCSEAICYAHVCLTSLASSASSECALGYLHQGEELEKLGTKGMRQRVHILAGISY